MMKETIRTIWRAAIENTAKLKLRIWNTESIFSYKNVEPGGTYIIDVNESREQDGFELLDEEA